MRRAAWIAVLIGTLAVLLPAASASANTYAVTAASSDAPDANTGDLGVCDSGGGTCTLRAAVQTANSAGSAGPDVIEIPAGTYTLTIPGTDDTSVQGDLDITTNLEIRGLGGGATITGNLPTPVDRILHIPSGIPNVSLSNLTITQGRAAAATQGGGIKLESGSLSISGGAVTNNKAFDTNSKGGGIYASSSATSLSLSDTTVSGNTVGEGAPLSSSGGGIHSEVPTTLSRVTISGNTAAFACTNTVSGCSGYGAGIQIWAGGTFTNVTVSNNIAYGSFAAAGGIAQSSDDPVTLLNSTVASNTAHGSGGGLVGANITKSGDPTILENTIVADPITPDLAAPNGRENCTVDASGGFTSAGHSLEAMAGFTTSQCGLTPGVNGDILTSDAMLGALAPNGGPTQTRALLTGSLAIDGGGPNGPATDQRGVARPQGAACDIGAYERDSTPPGPGFTCAGPPATTLPGTGTTPVITSPSPAPTLPSRKKCKKKKGAAAAKKCKKRR